MSCTKSGKEIPDGENKKENNKCLNIIDKIIVTVCIIFIILSIALACYSYITREIPGNTIGNIRNNGYATEQGNWIYYIAPVEKSTEYGIYKIKKNGKDKQKIFSTDEDIISLNVYKDNLYFIGITNIEDDNLDNKIYQMKLDGSDLKVINDNEFHDNCYEIYAVYDKIFYVGTNGNICIMNLDGSEKETFLDNRTGYLGVTEKYIIFDTLEFCKLSPIAFKMLCINIIANIPTSEVTIFFTS